MSQLPYAAICGIISIIGYITLGITNNMFIGLIITLLLLGVMIYILKSKSSSIGSPELITSSGIAAAQLTNGSDIEELQSEKGDLKV